MWTGVTGLLAHGEKMNVVGNNIANVSTVGFKSQRMDFADFVYQNAFTTAGGGQIGRGVKIGAIMGNFQQGPYESTTEATDLAITGRGFFQVKKVGSDQTYYTRAGNFRFNYEGFLMDPNGLALQGWRIDNSGGITQAAGGARTDSISSQKASDIIGSGVPTNIKLDTWTVIPQQTTTIGINVNLPANGADSFKSTTNPFAALFETWNGTQPPASATTKPLPNISDVFTTTLDIYDESGTKHTVSVYYDKVSSDDYSGGANNEEIWEYIVTIDPASDARMFFDTTTNSLRKVNETTSGGLLMSGTITFNSSGQMTNQTAYTWGGSTEPVTNPTSFTAIPDPADPLNTLQVINLDPSNMNNWTPAAISSSGLPIFVANFSGVLDAQTPGSPGGSKYNVELDFGVSASNFTMPWQNQTSLGSLSVLPYTNNSGYSSNNPLTGPEFVLLNTNYDPTLNRLTDLNAYQYQFTGAQSTPADIRKLLTQYTGANSIVIPQDSFGAGQPPSALTCTIPTASFDSNGFFDDTQNIAGTLADGTAFTIPSSAITGSGAIIDGLMDAKILAGAAADRSVLAAATAPNANNLALVTKPVVIASNSSTSYGNSKFVSNPTQNGYGFGDLTSWTVDADGVLSGVYSNGVTLPLWQITLYDFNCLQGLRREGSNLFSQTRESGDPKSGAAGSGGLGGIQGSTLEQSNVDMSTEFVQMISTQRGFQSNSKVITTTDTMLDTVINMKR